jgi:2-dehydro-3-deoxyphosphogluconate aldolase/(4S)-4-hydroxy-2-oxoglutarate aldolase
MLGASISMKYLKQTPLIGIIRNAETSEVESAVAAAMAGGLKTLEITLNRPEAIDQIARIKDRFAGEVELGAGTVLDKESAKQAIDAGAEFIVSPAVLPDVIEYCRSRSIPVFPGALSPTEVLNAYRAGAEMVKVFPIQSLGPAYIKSLKGPFPQIPLMPTGGVTLESVPHYFQAGADALGVGGELFNRDWLARKDRTSIEKTARAYVQAVGECR